MLRERSLTQALVFVNSKLGAARLARSFERDGLTTNALHGDKSQDERLKSLAAFKAGEVQLLVATDVAARGLDIADLPAVFNFDVPFNAEDYVHRIGRTGRAGASGLAVTLVTRDDTRLVADIEKLIKKKIDLEPFEIDDERPRRPPPRRSFEERQASPPVDTPPRRAPAAASRDPFFDRPYEAVSSDSVPAWEQTKSAPVPAGRALSPNIKPKKKVASLLGGKA
jgi:ATP-dependent RNA helicase RhlE